MIIAKISILLMILMINKKMISVQWIIVISQKIDKL
jgi:hypothetical protein